LWLEGIIAGARIDLEDLYDQQKQHDDDSGHSSRDMPPGRGRKRSAPTIIAPSFLPPSPPYSRPAPPIDDDDDDDDDERDEEDDSDNTRVQSKEHRRLIKAHIRTNYETSPVAQNIEILQIMTDSKMAHDVGSPSSYPYRPFTSIVIPYSSISWDQIGSGVTNWIQR
jgi:hypothetical protein